MIKSFEEFINENIKDFMTPKSREEIMFNKEKLISDTGYRKEIKNDVLRAIDKEMKNVFTKFGKSALGMVKWIVEDDFNFTPEEFNNGIKILLNEVLKPLIEKYKL